MKIDHQISLIAKVNLGLKKEFSNIIKQTENYFGIDNMEIKVD
jgi:hypothetical protein